jgi:hypothetical protein
MFLMYTSISKTLEAIFATVFEAGDYWGVVPLKLETTGAWYPWIWRPLGRGTPEAGESFERYPFTTLCVGQSKKLKFILSLLCV